jgi:hypothetical protein
MEYAWPITNFHKRAYNQESWDWLLLIEQKFWNFQAE